MVSITINSFNTFTSRHTDNVRYTVLSSGKLKNSHCLNRNQWNHSERFKQVLKILKQQIDAELAVCEESLEHVDNARTILIERELRLVNARKSAFDGSKTIGQNGLNYQQTSNTSSTTPPQLTPSSSYDPFKRTESKRKNLTNSISSIFRRSQSNSNSNNSNNSIGKSSLLCLFSRGNLLTK